MSNFGVFSGPYFPAFGPVKTLYLDNFFTVSMFYALINEDYSIDFYINRYHQGVLEYALSKGDFSIGTDIYMLTGNLSIRKTVGNNNKILISNIDMKMEI